VGRLPDGGMGLHGEAEVINDWAQPVTGPAVGPPARLLAFGGFWSGANSGRGKSHTGPIDCGVYTVFPQWWDSGMSTRTSRWPAGVPCWVDLATTDVAAARDFYGAVLGWSFQTGAALLE